MGKRNRYRCHRIFLDANGPGPWRCYGCSKPVIKLLVHHLDEDPSNDMPLNLVAMHRPCHQRLHQFGKQRTAEHRQAMSESQRGQIFTDEHRRNIGDASRGKPKPQRKFGCGDCDLTSNGAGISKHQRITGHQAKMVIE